MITNTNPQVLKTAIMYSMSNSIKKLKAGQGSKNHLLDRSLPDSWVVEVLLKFYNGLSGMMPLKSAGPFF